MTEIAPARQVEHTSPADRSRYIFRSGGIGQTHYPARLRDFSRGPRAGIRARMASGRQLRTRHATGFALQSRPKSAPVDPRKGGKLVDLRPGRARNRRKSTQERAKKTALHGRVMVVRVVIRLFLESGP